jgi:AraC-like DNA-binding protein
MRFKHENNLNTSARTVMDYEFDFCIECDREMYLDQKHYKIEKGCLVIRRPGQKVKTQGKYDCYMLTLDFSKRTYHSKYSRNTAEQMQETFDSTIWNVLPAVFKPAHYEDYLRIFESLTLINDMDINQNSKALPLVNQLVHLVISDAYLYLSPTNNDLLSPIDCVCSYIKNHYMEDIELDGLSSIAHLNKNYLVRQFKNSFGISPIAYLIKIRMEYAKKLLTESNLPIKTIATHCGYKDPSFFNFYFKKTFNISPASYRKAQQTDSQYDTK